MFSFGDPTQGFHGGITLPSSKLSLRRHSIPLKREVVSSDRIAFCLRSILKRLHCMSHTLLQQLLHLLSNKLQILHHSMLLQLACASLSHIASCHHSTLLRHRSMLHTLPSQLPRQLVLRLPSSMLQLLRRSKLLQLAFASSNQLSFFLHSTQLPPRCMLRTLRQRLLHSTPWLFCRVGRLPPKTRSMCPITSPQQTRFSLHARYSFRFTQRGDQHSYKASSLIMPNRHPLRQVPILLKKENPTI